MSRRNPHRILSAALDQTAAFLRAGKSPFAFELPQGLEDYLPEHYESAAYFLSKVMGDGPPEEVMAAGMLLTAALFVINDGIQGDELEAHRAMTEFLLQFESLSETSSLNPMGLMISAQAMAQVGWVDQAFIRELEEDMGYEPGEIAMGGVPEDLGPEAYQRIFEELDRDIYAAAVAIGGILNGVDDEALAGMMAEGLSAHNALLADVAVIALLDPSNLNRQAMAAALVAHPAAMTPEGLRRLITFRNWITVPEEQKLVDRAIVGARGAGIVCASVDAPRGSLERCHASDIDGAGALSAIFELKESRGKWRLGGIMAKQLHGVAGVLLGDPGSRADLQRNLEQTAPQIGLTPVRPEYLDLLVGHFLAMDGVAVDHELLQVAEYLGASWQPQILNIAAAIEEGFEGGNITALAADASWLDLIATGDSWFTSGDAVYDAVRRRRSRDRAVAVVLDEFLDQERNFWAEKLFWIAAPRLQRFTEGLFSDSSIAQPALAAAMALLEGRPLRDIAVMLRVAEQTVAAIKGD